MYGLGKKNAGFLLVNHKYKYVLQTFAKSGSSTLRALFLKVHCDEFSESDKSMIAKRGEYAYHYVFYNYIKRHNNILNIRLKNYHKFSIVRNTYDRVISMYLNQVLGVHDFNGLDPSRPLRGGYESKEKYLKNGVWSAITFDQFVRGLKNSKLLNMHYAPQFISENIDTYLYLNELSETLPRLYEDIIKVEDSKLSLIKELIQDRKERPKRKVYELDHKLNDYNFKKDELNLDIMKNGVPQKSLMFTEENAQIIKKEYKEEIDHHGFDYKHLLS
jgi:hypothetical protein